MESEKDLVKKIRKLINKDFYMAEMSRELGITWDILSKTMRNNGLKLTYAAKLRSRRNNAQKGGYKTTLCWDCSKATNSGCSWSRELKPVEGWDAKPITRMELQSYLVNYCPEFEEDTKYAIRPNNQV